MTVPEIAIAGVRARDLDFLLLEELWAGDSFWRWLVARPAQLRPSQFGF